MDVEENNPKVNHVMASSGATGSISVLLHPLVVMNISEHWTRVRAQEGKAQQGSIFEFEGDSNSYLYCVLLFSSDWCTDWEAERKKSGNHEFL